MCLYPQHSWVTCSAAPVARAGSLIRSCGTSQWLPQGQGPGPRSGQDSQQAAGKEGVVPAAVGLEMSGQTPRTRSLGERAELELGRRDAEPGGGRCHQADGSVAFLELASWTREGEELNG